MNAISSFRAAIQTWVATRGLSSSYGRGKRGRSRNVLTVSTSPKPTTLYVKESNSEPGFWGLTRNHIDSFEASEGRWFVILLRGPERGYVLSGGQVLNRVDGGSFELGRDGEYKVNERPDLAEGQDFHSLDELLQRIV